MNQIPPKAINQEVPIQQVPPKECKNPFEEAGHIQCSGSFLGADRYLPSLESIYRGLGVQISG